MENPGRVNIYKTNKHNNTATNLPRSIYIDNPTNAKTWRATAAVDLTEVQL